MIEVGSPSSATIIHEDNHRNGGAGVERLMDERGAIGKRGRIKRLHHQQSPGLDSEREANCLLCGLATHLPLVEQVASAWY